LRRTATWFGRRPSDLRGAFLDEVGIDLSGFMNDAVLKSGMLVVELREFSAGDRVRLRV